MTGGQDLGGATGYIKAITLFPFPHQRKVFKEGLLDRHALCVYAGENTSSIVKHTSQKLAQWQSCYVIQLVSWIDQYGGFSQIQSHIT